MSRKIFINYLAGMLLPVIFLMFSQSANSQQPIPTTQVMPDTARMTFNQISQALGLFVYPSNNQNQHQQKRDEFGCYQWATEQSGIDPLNLPRIEVQQSTGPTGGAVRGAARGAAAGAAIGAIAGDAGRGAAIGATAGALGGRSAGRQMQAQQNQQAQANAAAQERAMMDRFRQGFSACMSGRNYTIK
ncbi:MAG: glycine zipper domain-containing protein [Cyclobacteriaceae bacterium]|jgi:hypothetical protein|nr:glycine zipper domain-containing protein [Cyclobacteriaceae bacterium]